MSLSFVQFRLAHIAQRVYITSVFNHAKMQMIAGGIAGGTYRRDRLTRTDRLSGAHIQCGSVHVYGRQTVSMGNDYVVARRTAVGRRGHTPACRSYNRCSVGSTDIDAFMIG